MATYDSAWLLDRWNRLVGRPVSDAMPDAAKYDYLTEAQNQVVADLAAIYPQALYPVVSDASLPTLTTTDSRTFTFGTDANGNPIAPIGRTAIYTSPRNVPDSPWTQGRDYLVLGGTAIQLPNNRTYGGTLYWRGISPPADLSETVQPALYPVASRELIALRAAHTFLGDEAKNLVSAQTMADRYGIPLDGASQPGRFAYWCLTWKTAFRQGGALVSLTGRQVAVGSAYNHP